MNSRSLICFLTVFSLLASAQIFNQSNAPMKIESLAWLAGSWNLQRNASTVEEHWTAPAGHTMIGMSRTVRDGRTTEFEFLRIEERTGKLVYLAQPQGRAATEFVATSVSADEVLFENPTHDFPKAIRYHRVSDKCVTASVEDATGKKKIEFPYCRAD